MLHIPEQRARELFEAIIDPLVSSYVLQVGGRRVRDALVLWANKVAPVF